jgi:hypothetical protein
MPPFNVRLPAPLRACLAPWPARLCVPLRARRSALLAALCLVLAACSPRLDWRELHADDGGFTVLFPQKPGQAEKALATPLGQVTMKLYSVRIDDTMLGAGFADFAAPVDAHALDVMRDALVKSLHGRLVSEKPVSSAGPQPLAGRELVIAGAPAEGGADRDSKSAAVQMRARLYARDKRYYQVLLVGRAGAFEAADADMFLTSFKPY